MATFRRKAIDNCPYCKKRIQINISLTEIFGLWGNVDRIRIKLGLSKVKR